jgi:hypothetical protein
MHTMFGSLVSRVRIAAIASAVVLAAATTAQADITVTRVDIGLPNTAVFQIAGGFDGNEILRFKSAIADVPPNVRIVAALHSPGGHVTQGFALGKFFHEARIATMVLAGHMCASACTDAFFGGRDAVSGQPMRIMASGARLGFHNSSLTSLPEQAYTKADAEKISRITQSHVYDRLIYFKSVDAPVRAIALSLSTPHEDINWLGEGDALSFGITILNLETGRFVSPGNLASRTR